MSHIIICDESSTDDNYMVVGGLIIPPKNYELLIEEFLTWKATHKLNPHSEFKWTKVSNRYLPLYLESIEWFFRHLHSNHVTFRALVVNTRVSEYHEYGKGNTETSFYKVYHHLLLNAAKQILETDPSGKALVLLDDKTNNYPFRLDVLKKTLNSALRRDVGRSNAIANVEPRKSSGESNESLIQIVDILIGAVSFIRNGRHELPSASKPKIELASKVAELAKTDLAFDTGSRAAFNLWTLDVRKMLEAKKRRSPKGSAEN
ncbi:DUF3800 domain-containing protein [bacterium]|nr:DUF3800 domain-containing protein [bacterium]